MKESAAAVVRLLGKPQITAQEDQAWDFVSILA
jgi:hypothetical protein